MPKSNGLASNLIALDEPLKPYTTFKVGGPADIFITARSASEIIFGLAFEEKQKLPLFTLGGGSNILVSDHGFAGKVLHPVIKGKGVVHEDPESVVLEVNAGEIWDDVARFTVEKGWWGIENLSHIPGQSGAALVQNIGAYGQQVSDVLLSAEVIDATRGVFRQLTAADCGFGYRRSIFNSTAHGEFIITKLTLRLAKAPRPCLGYPDVQAYFAERNIGTLSLSEIRQAIITIRDRKFPFPREERGGNAGSFFENLSLNEVDYAYLREMLRRNFSSTEVARLEEIQKRFSGGNRTKVPSAFLIDICGLKGQCIGGAEVNESQPLVLINRGGATAQDVLALARHVRRTVKTRTGMTIDIEPELVGFTSRELEYLYSFD